jgi:hypothetical protein
MSHSEKPQRKDPVDHVAAAKSALIFALLYLLVVAALWGYVYLTLLERGMTQ